MFFQDFCYILYEKVIDGESFISNIWIWKSFTHKEINNYRKKMWNDNFINIKYLITDWYISEEETWKYEILLIDEDYIKLKEYIKRDL
jgi:hypothetical protein